jgi:hypothetical protein
MRRHGNRDSATAGVDSVLLGLDRGTATDRKLCVKGGSRFLLQY